MSQDASQATRRVIPGASRDRAVGVGTPRLAELREPEPWFWKSGRLRQAGPLLGHCAARSAGCEAGSRHPCGGGLPGFGRQIIQRLSGGLAAQRTGGQILGLHPRRNACGRGCAGRLWIAWLPEGIAPFHLGVARSGGEPGRGGKAPWGQFD